MFLNGNSVTKLWSSDQSFLEQHVLQWCRVMEFDKRYSKPRHSAPQCLPYRYYNWRIWEHCRSCVVCRRGGGGSQWHPANWLLVRPNPSLKHIRHITNNILQNPPRKASYCRVLAHNNSLTPFCVVMCVCVAMLAASDWGHALVMLVSALQNQSKQDINKGYRLQVSWDHLKNK